MAETKIQKLNKMQINRLDSQLTIKINQRVQEVRNVDTSDLSKERQVLVDKIINKLEKLYFATHKDQSILPYGWKNNKQGTFLPIARMMKLPEAKRVVDIDKAITKICDTNYKKANALKEKLFKKKVDIMNDAYFRDAQFALDALEKF